MNTLKELDRNPLQEFKSINPIIFLAIIIHVVLIRIFLVPDPFKLKLHNYAFSEQKMDTFAPNYLIVESNIWSSKLWVLQENPLDKSSIIKKKPKVEISISLYKANQIYRFIKQLISDEELKRYEDYCCTAGSFFGELTNTSMGSHNFSDSFPCGLFERDFDKELFKMIESELQEARVKSNRISFFERFR